MDLIEAPRLNRREKVSKKASKTQNHRAFLRDLKALTIKHGVEIGGCGCCGSPWLKTAPKNPEAGFYRYRDGDPLQFIHPSDDYNWENHGGEKP